VAALDKEKSFEYKISDTFPKLVP